MEVNENSLSASRLGASSTNFQNVVAIGKDVRSSSSNSRNFQGVVVIQNVVAVAGGSRPQPWSPQSSDDEADSTGPRQGWEVAMVERESVICSRLYGINNTQNPANSFQTRVF